MSKIPPLHIARGPEHAMSGAEELRTAARYCDNSNESALDPFTAEELIQCWRAYRLSGWDLTISDWTPEQRRDAARRGIVPQWDTKTEAPLPGIHWTHLPKESFRR